MVYVDDMNIPYGRMKLCHMFADSDEELHEMAEKIGVPKKLWQSPQKTSGIHYDICLTKKAKAIELGAVSISWRQAGCMNARRRYTGKLGTPEEAETWLINYKKNKII